MEGHYKFAVFDLDGTIYDSTPANIMGLADMLRSRGRLGRETYDSLLRFAGTPAEYSLRQLGFTEDEVADGVSEWYNDVMNHAGNIKIFPRLLSAVKFIRQLGYHTAIVTSRDHRGEEILGQKAAVFPLELRDFFDFAVGADDTTRGKPYPDPLQKCASIAGIKTSEILYIGDTASDFASASAAGCDFGLALWGYEGQKHLRCRWHFADPYDAAMALTSRRSDPPVWFSWAKELAAIGQTGLHYCKDLFDRERYERLSEIACEIVSTRYPDEGDLKAVITSARGYPCPKLDTRAAVFNKKDEILMVQENSGLWDLPGGWLDEGQTVVTNALKELREEACMESSFVKLIAVMDRNRHNSPVFSYGVIKCFVECSMGEWNFAPTNETKDCRFFSKDQLPFDRLRLDTCTKDQILMCFDAHADKSWRTLTE